MSRQKHITWGAICALACIAQQGTFAIPPAYSQQAEKRFISTVVLSETFSEQNTPTTDLVDFLKDRGNLGYHFLVDRS